MQPKPHAAPQPLAVFRGHSTGVNDIDFDGKNQRLLSASLNGEIKLWDIATRRVLSAIIAHKGTSVLTAIFGPDDTVYSHGRDGMVTVWNVAGGEWRQLSNLPCSSYSFCRCMHDPLTDSLLLPTEDGKVEMHDLRSGAVACSFSVEGRDKTGLLMNLCLAPMTSAQQQYLYAGYESGHVAIWRQDGPNRPVLFERLHEEPVLAVQCSPDGAQLATGGADKKFRLMHWQPNLPRRWRACVPPPHLSTCS
eukprot:GGOE01020078.1.p1 GENE.GGOE01020078.1~~GGOE01020078.1.p1  ORF type:complete len:249 (-),score=29.28 GGOE01020078.1:255-1001(-)